jgi:hypothetical protein
MMFERRDFLALDADIHGSAAAVTTAAKPLAQSLAAAATILPGRDRY